VVPDINRKNFQNINLSIKLLGAMSYNRKKFEKEKQVKKVKKNKDFNPPKKSKNVKHIRENHFPDYFDDL